MKRAYRRLLEKERRQEGGMSLLGAGLQEPLLYNIQGHPIILLFVHSLSRVKERPVAPSNYDAQELLAGIP